MELRENLNDGSSPGQTGHLYIRRSSQSGRTSPFPTGASRRRPANDAGYASSTSSGTSTSSPAPAVPSSNLPSSPTSQDAVATVKYRKQRGRTSMGGSTKSWSASPSSSSARFLSSDSPASPTSPMSMMSPMAVAVSTPQSRGDAASQRYSFHGDLSWSAGAPSSTADYSSGTITSTRGGSILALTH